MIVAGEEVYGVNLRGRSIRALRRESEVLEQTRAGYDERGLIDTASWKKAPLIQDEYGNLTIGGHAVMEPWEEPYMAALAKIASSRKGHVLEFGYGTGLSAYNLAKRYAMSARLAKSSLSIVKHTIIEGHPAVAHRARGFADFCNRRFAGVEIVVLEGMWQDLIGTLEPEAYDGILYDCYPTRRAADSGFPPDFEVMNQLGTICGPGWALLKRGGVLTCYSDRVHTYTPEDIAAFEAAGFTIDDAHIGGHVVDINPPPGCEYCNVKHLLAPRLVK